MTLANVDFAQDHYVWPDDDLTVIPDWVYTDQKIYEREVERIFHGRTWNYVALEAEVPNSGDFIRSNVGPTAVVVARGEDGSIGVFENRCVHRASEFCRELSGNARAFICPYHQWTYDLKGNLVGIPFRRGAAGKGGMPTDFEIKDHGHSQARGDNAPRGRLRVLCGRHGIDRRLSRSGSACANSRRRSTAAS